MIRLFESLATYKIFAFGLYFMLNDKMLFMTIEYSLSSSCEFGMCRRHEKITLA